MMGRTMHCSPICAADVRDNQKENAPRTDTVRRMTHDSLATENSGIKTAMNSA